LVINKVEDARAEDVAAVKANLRGLNQSATVSEGTLRVSIELGASLRGKRVLVIEDGPTITHGGMASGAGLRAAQMFGAEAVDPRPWAVGSIRDAFDAFRHIGPVLPALGYGEAQLHELEETVRAVPCNLVVVASPVDLRHLINFDQPTVRANYEFEMVRGPSLEQIVAPIKMAVAKQL
jgi:predicted GTPase